MKTIEQIIEDNTIASYGSGNAKESVNVRACMEEYAEQFKTKWIDVKTEFPEDGKQVNIQFGNPFFGEMDYDNYGSASYESDTQKWTSSLTGGLMIIIEVHHVIKWAEIIKPLKTEQ